MAVTDTLDADDQSAPGTMTKSELIAKLAERFPQLVAKDAEYAVRPGRHGPFPGRPASHRDP